MNIEIIDLYSYFSAERLGAEGGYLTLMHSPDCAKNSNRKKPSMLVIAGGGYEIVSPREKDPVAIAYLNKGFDCFVLDYSVKVGYPAQFVEAALAMLYIKQNATRLNLLTDKIAAIGFSAGAHLLGCIACLFDSQNLKDALFERGVSLASGRLVRPDAAIMCYPVVTSLAQKCHKGSFENLCKGDNRLIEALSLENCVNKDTSPMFIWHTLNDNSVSCYNSLALASACERFGVSFSLHIFEKGNHGLSLADFKVSQSENLKNASSNVSEWFNLSVCWLFDRGFKMS